MLTARNSRILPHNKRPLQYAQAQNHSAATEKTSALHMRQVVRRKVWSYAIAGPIPAMTRKPRVLRRKPRGRAFVAGTRVALPQARAACLRSRNPAVERS